MRSFKKALNIAKKDLLEFSRSKIRLFITIFMPLFMMIMASFIFPNQSSLNNIPIGLVVGDQSSISQQVISFINKANQQENYFKIDNIDSKEEAITLINSGQINGAIVIPSNFSESINQGRQAEIIILKDDTNPQASMLITSALDKILTAARDTIGTQNVKQILESVNPELENKTTAIIKPFVVKISGTFKNNANYIQFVAPGMMMMVVLMSIMTGLPRAISFEREIGTMDGLLAAPVSIVSILGGKAIAQTARGLFQAIMILILSILIFGVRIYGNIFLVLLLLILGVFSFIGLGIALTSIAKDQETASMLITTFMFPMMFLSGVFFPIDQMPKFMQLISKFIPLTYAADALRRVMTLGVSLSAVSLDIIVLSVFGVVMLGIAVPLFKKMMTR